MRARGGSELKSNESKEIRWHPSSKSSATAPSDGQDSRLRPQLPRCSGCHHWAGLPGFWGRWMCWEDLPRLRGHGTPLVLCTLTLPRASYHVQPSTVIYNFGPLWEAWGVSERLVSRLMGRRFLPMIPRGSPCTQTRKRCLSCSGELQRSGQNVISAENNVG